MAAVFASPVDLARTVLPERRFQSLLPALTRLFETTYLASLNTEEGRPLQFEVHFADPSDVGQSSDGPEKRCFTVFGGPRPFIVSEVVKLALATDLRSITDGDLTGATWFVSLLSRVDGCVFVDRDLRVHGFGTMIGDETPLTVICVANSADPCEQGPAPGERKRIRVTTSINDATLSSNPGCGRVRCFAGWRRSRNDDSRRSPTCMAKSSQVNLKAEASRANLARFG